jgi:exonuclease SbcC
MRPLRVELEGFTAFRTRTEVDLRGAELFAFTGATGSGKTSIVDAMCFALYGSVPRLDDRRRVEPIISQGANEARVRFDFAVGDREYTAVRVVRRTKTGATTKEARLESTSPTAAVLAGNERELTAEVERLLGLDFDHFTTCVVLPQGEFARFLHGKRERRQELLVRLLDLGVYERMGRLARARGDTARVRLELIERDLASLVSATPEALSTAVDGLARLEQLRDDLDDDALPRLAALGAQVDEAVQAVAAAAERSSLLGEVEVPSDVVVLGDDVDAAATDLDRVRAEAASADDELSTADETLRRLPARHELVAAADAHAAAARLDGAAASDAAAVVALTAAVEAAEAVATDAERSLADATQALDDARDRDRAHALRAHLRAGEPCPVCEREVTDVPAPTTLRAGADDLDTLVAARGAAEDRCRAAARALADAGRDLAATQARAEVTAARRHELAPVLAQWPDLTAVAALLAAHDEADATTEAARRRAASAHAAVVEAERRSAALSARQVEVRRAFDQLRDRLVAAGLAPPPRDDTAPPAELWRNLAAWARDRGEREACAAAEAQRRATELRAERDGLVHAVATRCAEAGVVARAGVQLRDAVADAVAGAAVRVAEIEKQLADIERLEGERATASIERDVAAELARHLQANRFEGWVLDEALSLLVAGATTVLQQLSGGQYSLAVDPATRGFLVVDHRNADEARLARTLSGGETFLASLALALALADQVALLAAEGSARLESIFLDEGFGSLDPETLDTVASAIEELGASGRVVGLISHVPELAERVPVRFEVRKVGASASVERVDR